jgi:hypothetical protein
MARLYLILLLLSITFIVSAQKTKNTCTKQWVYLRNADFTSGILLKSFRAPKCGKIITASMSIIRTEIGDTVRFLNICDTAAPLPAGTRVTFLVYGFWPRNRLLKVPEDPETDCSVRITFHGRLNRQDSAQHGLLR